MADDPFDEVVLDDDFVAGGPREASAEERVSRARRIAAQNDALRAAGEISSGTGKPRFHAARRTVPWIALGLAIGGVIVVLALVAR